MYFVKTSEKSSTVTMRYCTKG